MDEKIEEALGPQFDVMDLIFAAEHGDLDESPRTVRGEFPGSRDRAMGHAWEVVDMLEEAGVSVELEYVGVLDGFDELHEIDILINGGEP